MVNYRVLLSRHLAHLSICLPFPYILLLLTYFLPQIREFAYIAVGCKGELYGLAAEH